MNDEPRGMVSGLIRFCMEQKLVVALLLLFFIGWGVRVAPFDWDIEWMPRDPVAVDAIPDIGENQQIVFTEWPGRSPQNVEDQVTYPLTVNLLGIAGVKDIRSQSFFGFSTIFVIFEEDVEFYWSRSRILEKLGSLPAGTLPDGVQPALGPDATGLGQVYWYTLEGRDARGRPIGGWDLDELRAVQDWYVRYALAASGGVAEVASIGGHVREYQVDVDPDAMRAYGVTLREVFSAVRQSNVDVGARTIEVNKVEYLIRGLGFIRSIEDIEKAVLKTVENTPITVRQVARVTLGPAMRRGALDKGGAEAVGGVVAARFGENPLRVIEQVKKQIELIASGMPMRPVVDWSLTTAGEVEAFAREEGFAAFEGASPSMALREEAWLGWLSAHEPEDWPAWINTSKVTIVPFYDRSGLIAETLGTLNEALVQQILVTVIVVIVMVMHLRGSVLIGAMLPLAVLITFIAMKLFKVDANIVALSGIAIAIGTVVDVGIVLTENTLRHLEAADPKEPRLKVIHRAASEVGSAVLTAVMTTVVGFLPVFTMIGAEGKLFRPLAFTKTFALIASIIVALTIIPPVAHVLLRKGMRLPLPGRIRRPVMIAGNLLVAFAVAWVLAEGWMPLGAARGAGRNIVFVIGLIGGLLLVFRLFQLVYPMALRWCLDHKLTFLTFPALLVGMGAYVWLGPGYVLGPMDRAPVALLGGEAPVARLMDEGLLQKRAGETVWTAAALAATEEDMRRMLERYEAPRVEQVLSRWGWSRELIRLRSMTPAELDADEADSWLMRLKWMVARDWQGLGREFMPSLDEGSFLFMPTTMAHASIGQAKEILAIQDRAIEAVPEVESVVGKLGRAESPLDPAPVSMYESVVNYRSEYILDAHGKRVRFRYDRDRDDFVRDERGELIPDRRGRPYRQWRDHITSPDDIWREIEAAARLPGVTGAPKLQPIETRLVMLQTGMRAPMGIKVTGPDLASIEAAGIRIEELLKRGEVPGVDVGTVIAERIVGTPYLEIEIDREAIARFGLRIADVQDVIEVAIGGTMLTRTVEGRERYPVRVRYLRELRDSIETIERVLVPGADGAQIPLGQLAEIRYERGPMQIRSENTFLVGYVTFGKLPGYAEVQVVDSARAYLEQKQEAGELRLGAGVSYRFAGSYENQLRAARTLAVVLPLALFVIFLILYLQFRDVPVTLLVFTGVFVAWSGGFLMIWLYNQPWFADFAVFGVNMREMFQMPAVDPRTGATLWQVNLSVAVWVGFLALFGIATDDGVLMATYIRQSMGERRANSIAAVRAAIVVAANRRCRAALMTSATTILALLPVLTSTGKGSDIMVPMAIPSFGGMLVALLTLFTVPTMYAILEELRWRMGGASRG